MFPGTSADNSPPGAAGPGLQRPGAGSHSRQSPQTSLAARVAMASLFEFPYEWIIKFSSSVRKYAYDFTPCALTNFSATYNGQGSPVFYEHTGAPIQVDISMQFKEVEIITKAKLKREGRGESFGKGSRESKDIAAGGAKATAAGGEATTTGGSF